MCDCCACVPQSEVGVIESCGRYKGLAAPGFVCLRPCVDRVAGRVSLRILQKELALESKTKDNVFVRVEITVQYQVLPGAIDVAFYTLRSPTVQLEAYIQSYIRAVIPMYSLEDLYMERNSIADELKLSVDEKMDTFGYDILSVLLTDIVASHAVTRVMDSLLANTRLESAAKDAAAAECILLVRKAEAKAETMRLQATGIAGQRAAVVSGLKESIDSFRTEVPALNKEELLSLLLTTQYLDTVRTVALQGQMTDDPIYLPHVSTLGDMAAQLTAASFAPAPSRDAVSRALANKQK